MSAAIMQGQVQSALPTPQLAGQLRNSAVYFRPARRVSAAQRWRSTSQLRQAIPVTGPGSGSPTGPGDTYSEDPPSIDAETAMISQNVLATMQGKIKEALETDQVEIADAYGDGRHVSIDVISPIFEGKSSVQRQRMVYKAIWFELQELVHAVDAMTTKTPEEAAAS